MSSGRRLGRFRPPTGADKQVAHKVFNRVTGLEEGSIDQDTLGEWVVALEPEAAAKQRLLVQLYARLELALLQAPVTTNQPRTGCGIVPLPRGAYTGLAVVVGGGRNGKCESFTGNGWTELPALQRDRAYAGVAVVPLWAGGRKVWPAVVAVGGLAGGQVLRSVEAFRSTIADPDRAWTDHRLPSLPRPIAAAGIGVACTRRWLNPLSEVRPAVGPPLDPPPESELVPVDKVARPESTEPEIVDTENDCKNGSALDADEEAAKVAKATTAEADALLVELSGPAMTAQTDEAASESKFAGLTFPDSTKELSTDDMLAMADGADLSAGCEAVVNELSAFVDGTEPVAAAAALSAVAAEQPDVAVVAESDSDSEASDLDADAMIARMDEPEPVAASDLDADEIMARLKEPEPEPVAEPLAAALVTVVAAAASAGSTDVMDMDADTMLAQMRGVTQSAVSLGRTKIAVPDEAYVPKKTMASDLPAPVTTEAVDDEFDTDALLAEFS